MQGENSETNSDMTFTFCVKNYFLLNIYDWLSMFFKWMKTYPNLEVDNKHEFLNKIDNLYVLKECY